MACNECTKYKTCKEPCYFLEVLIKGTGTRLKESPMMVKQDTLKSEKYGDVLSAIFTSDKRSEKEVIKRIRSIKDHRLRAYASMIFSGLTVLDISQISFPNHYVSIYAIIRKGASQLIEPARVVIDLKLLTPPFLKPATLKKMLKKRNCWVCLFYMVPRCKEKKKKINEPHITTCKKFKYNLRDKKK